MVVILQNDIGPIFSEIFVKIGIVSFSKYTFSANDGFPKFLYVDV